VAIEIEKLPTTVVDIHNASDFNHIIGDHLFKHVSIAAKQTVNGVTMRDVDLDYHRKIGTKERLLGRQYLTFSPHDKPARTK
jgi:hypothetical protein